MVNTKNEITVQPYLFFDGRCEEAMEFYKTLLGAKVDFLMRFKDSPDPNSCMPGVDKNKVMHVSFRIGSTSLMASDGQCMGKPNFQGFSLSLNLADEAEAERIFNALANGGQVQVPLSKTFFSPRFGMVADKFGLGWMIHVLPPSKPFVISRTFDAPRDRVWKAWTDRESLMQWFSPKGFKMTTAKLDLRPGGVFHYCMSSPDGKQMWGKFTYREIAAPDRIVLVSSFSDEAGNITRHPMAPTWPQEMLSTSTFTEQNGKTTFTIETTPINPKADEQKMFDGAHEGMKQGWTGTFEQLAEYLAKN